MKTGILNIQLQKGFQVMDKVINGRKLADEILHKVTQKAQVLKEKHNKVAKIVTILVGDNSASEIYIKAKLRAAEKVGIETRPIISGNFMNQPAIKLYGLNKKKKKFENAQLLEKLGFFIGLHTSKMNSNLAEYVANNLLKINRI